MADPGFPIEGADLRHGHFSVKMYAKMKELVPVGGSVPHFLLFCIHSSCFTSDGHQLPSLQILLLLWLVISSSYLKDAWHHARPLDPSMFYNKTITGCSYLWGFSIHVVILIPGMSLEWFEPTINTNLLDGDIMSCLTLPLQNVVPRRVGKLNIMLLSGILSSVTLNVTTEVKMTNPD